ncbi:hypothetical protein XFF6166_590124 [Xanthomonas citri pv. fuscans]|nr:hypothetical protein XFF6166_590124 [Xanthomonas citri pv. fuscans]SOO00831.1 hypothetical protein XFF6960_370123 [Xanthomonas citri pv. fuscans]SOO06487.1 hypothetical protein XFF7767_700124 [Xanthomonas citri pv. fuscans]SOO15431.1 hypothetical protein XFF7766_570014 [Xanthomonas citri pv. fuscans]SOO43493.1 hypothetical protein XFF1815_390014 [Xanthomonas citri pv. fuscans]
MRQRTVNARSSGGQPANLITHCNFSRVHLCQPLTHPELQHVIYFTFKAELSTSVIFRHRSYVR